MVRVVFNVGNISRRIHESTQRATFDMAQRALADCNYYCKRDSETLINSSLIYSKFEEGKLIWQTPYARRQYYLRATRTDGDRRRNARWMWAKHAASCHKEQWFAVFRASFRRHSRGDGSD